MGAFMLFTENTPHYLLGLWGIREKIIVFVEKKSLDFVHDYRLKKRQDFTRKIIFI